MNALVRKEMRLLWPSWAGALLMAFSIWFVPKNQSGASGFTSMFVVVPFIACPVMLVILTLSSFGREITSNTFSNLLVQPIPRARIWWTKTLLLAAAVVFLWMAWWFSFLQSQDFRRASDGEIRNSVVISFLFVLAVYSGGLWTVLLFRQVAAAFWFTLLLPATIVMMTEYLFQNHADWTIKAFFIALSVYSLAGFLFARWLFLRAQDVHWTGGTIAWPRWRKKAAIAKGRAKRRGPWRALFAKEIHLHQSQLVIAGILALLHLGVVLTKIFAGDIKGHLILEIVFDGFWVLWFVMPLLIGCDAVAEERKLGTLEAQLCLPVRRCTQFVIKFVTTLLLSMLLGVIMPVLFEGSRILPSGGDFSNRAGTPFASILFGDLAMDLGWTIPFFILAGIAVLTVTISFYASTLARSTVQALAPAVLGVIVTWVSLLAGESIHGVFPFWRGWLGHIIGVPVMTLVLFGLMYWNFKRVLVGATVWRRNALVLILSFSFVTIATASIYNRAWELLTPAEPAHGSARLAARTTTLKASGNTVIVQLADGRVWTTRFKFFPILAPRTSGPGNYMEGTNWAAVDKRYPDFVGIQRDGSLWTLSQTGVGVEFELGSRSSQPAPRWIKVGSENDWKSVVAGNGPQAFLLKTNGTLWRLGTNAFPEGMQSWPGLGAFAPQQLGTDSDWAEIFSSPNRRTIFRKMDGRVWVNPPISLEQEEMKLQPDFAIHRAPHFDVYKTMTELFGPFGIFSVGIRDDGSFRVATTVGLFARRSMGSFRTLESADIPLNSETNWIALGGNLDQMVTLRDDGTLWKWTFPDHPIRGQPTAFSVPLSKHSDWVAIVPAMNGLVSLAADGSLWFWQLELGRFHGSDSMRLLKTSRRPQFIGNIFAATSP